MPNKTDLNDVNLLQLYEAHKQYDQLISNAEGVDKATKDVLQFSALWNLHKHVVPTRQYVPLSSETAGIYELEAFRFLIHG